VLSSATTPTTYAYVGDSTPAEERSGGIGILGAAMGLGMIFGPAFGGWLGGDSLSTPFFVTGGLALVTLLLLLRFLPESLPAHERVVPSSADWSSPAARLRRTWAEWWELATGPVFILLFLAFLVSFALTNFQGIFGLYALHKFGYGTERVGWILTTMGAVAVIAQGLLAGPLTKRWGERPLIKWTLLAGAVTFLLLLRADTFSTVLLATALFTLPNALLRPAVVALTSTVDPERQGVLMGLSNSANNVGRTIAPIWAGFVFDININYPYLSGAVILFAGFLVSLRWLDATRANVGPESTVSQTRRAHPQEGH
jgi:DHA1 family multidrug resistance protein-like MFS transporter